VRSLSRRPPEAPLKGSATAGKQVFSGKGGCTMCHMVDGEGGRLGPDLSLIGETRSAQHLRTSVLKPNAQVFTYDRSIRAVTRDGKAITGRRLNEDTYSVQLLDSQERMVSLLKDEISSYEIASESSMPSYEGKLSEKELDDLVTYLASLQRKRNP
jgi:putative heme-binding domain-containing protein